MDHTPKLSIIIPCYNHGHFIREAVASVEKCDRELYELIIVDDGSNDEETPRVFSDLKNAGYNVIYQDNRGVGAARNAGIRLSRGEFILPLDSDNKVRCNFIDRALSVFEKNPDVGVVYGNMQYFGEFDLIVKIQDFNIEELLFLNYIDACAIYRKKVWEDVGGYDEHMPEQGVEDWDFWINAYSKGWNFVHIDEVAQDYRAVNGSMLGRLKEDDGYQRCKEYIFRKHSKLIKKHFDEIASWEYHGRQLRSRPLYSIFRLAVSAISPKLHNRRFKRQ